jgi:Ca2+-binding EF-hand superfamily protein
MRIGVRQILIIASFIALCAPAADAQAGKGNAQQRNPTSRPRSVWAGVNCEELFQRLDADHDGAITSEEWQRFFRDSDDNKDGLLTPAEIPQSMSADEKGASDDADSGREQGFDRLDVNKDGSIERSEWPGNDKVFKRIDANRDGVLSREEFLSRNGRFWNITFEDLDFNRDGIVSHSEWLDSDQAFQRLDRDGNGTIDRWEFYNPR